METNPSDNLDLTNPLLPNSTQIPHAIIRHWLPLLKHSELCVLLIIADQTLGWVADAETGRRKAEDWLNNWQLQKRTGLSHKSIRTAIQTLVDYGLILVYSDTGALLETAAKRINAGSKLFFRLNTQGLTQKALFGYTPAKNAGGTQNTQNKRGLVVPPIKSSGAKKYRATKLTALTKLNTSNNNASVVLDKKKQGITQTQEQHYTIKGNEMTSENDKKTLHHKPHKPHSEILPTRDLIGAFKTYCVGIRGVEPQFVRYKDGNLIKHALRHLNANDIQMLFLWFLQNCTNMQPSLGAALCREVIAAYIKASHSEYGFYNNMDRLARQYAKPITKPNSLTEIDAQANRLKLLAEMKAQLFNKNKNAALKPLETVQS